MPDPSAIPVVYVIATLDRAGAEQQMTLLATRLDRGRFSPTVVCLTRGGSFEARLRQADVPCDILGKRRKWDRRALAALKRIIRGRQAQVVHTWLFTGNAYGRWAARACRVPAIIASERSVDDWRSWRHRLIDRHLGRRTDAIVANCRAVRDFVVREGIDAGRVRVIENAIDLEAFDEAASDEPLDGALDDLDERFIVIQAGRLEPQKGVEDLLAAADLARRRIPDLVLLLAGEGPDRRAVERRIAELGLGGHARLLGLRADVPALLARSDVVVLASRWEGLPNVVIEGMAARRPVVVTAVDGCRELVEDGRTGLLVPPAAPERLARAIEQIHDDPALGLELGSAARAEVEDRFGVQRMVRAYQDLYLECLAKGKSGGAE